jgi:hypothetical protein
MEKPDTTPLYIRFADESGETKVIVQDGPQRRLDAARALYRKRYNEGYSLSEQGFSEAAQGVLDRANAALRAAEEAYAAARGRTT